MIRAWRRADGKYRLDFGKDYTVHLTYPENGGDMSHLGGEWDDEHRMWVVPESGLEPFRRSRSTIEKMYGVVAGPSSCGCEPAGFRWVTESEVKAGQTTMKPCHDCAMRRFHPPSGPFAYVRHQCDIIDVCGEADFAEAVYAAEFAHRVGAIT